MARDPNALAMSQTQQFVLAGGVDQVSPAMALKPGVARDALNYECNVLGGYTRITGYERFDGRVKPSEQPYSVMQAQQLVPFVVGQLIHGAVSNATAVIAYITPHPAGGVYLVLAKLQGTFIVNEFLLVGGNAYGKALSQTQRSGAPTPKTDAQWKKYVEDIYRLDIQAVPGSGRVLGVWFYNDVVYAFRNHTDGLSAKMWKATSTGWQLVTTPTLQPGGKYEFVNANFGGTAAMKKMFGVDGVNKGFMFDGTTFTQITTGMAIDAPEHLAYHKQFLFYSFRASLQHSSIGNPTQWSVVTGAGEIALGDNITSIISYTSGTSGGSDSSNAALLIHTMSTTQILYGSSELDFSLAPVSTQQGGMPHTVQLLDQPYFISDLGVVNLSTTQNFGNFQQSSLSQQMNPFIVQERARAISSCIVREKSQYRVFFSDGLALYLSFVNGKIIGLMPINLNVQVACICSLKSSNNDELIFFGDDEGMVYQMDKGNNFDGDSIPSYIHLAFSAFRSPRIKKAWKRGTLEMNGTGYFELELSSSLGWGSADIATTPAYNVGIALKEAVWDQFVWDQFFWDGQNEGPTVFELNGSSENISLRLMSEGDCFAPFTVSSVLYHYLMRRQLRSDN
jgi:hypothetical protein